MKTYIITIEAKITSKLSPKELKGQLVCALYNSENGKTEFDGESDNLRVLDYHETDII